MWEQLVNWVEQATPFLHANLRWMGQAALTLMLTLAAGLVAGRVFARLETRLGGTSLQWDQALVQALRPPANAIIWIMGLNIFGRIIHAETELPLLALGPKLSEVLIILVASWGVLRFINRGSEAVVANRTRRGKPTDLTTVDAIKKVLKVSTVVIVGLILLQSLGYSMNAVLTFGGISGVAVGFAAKDLLANFFGALMIYLDRPFKIGDWIRSPDREIEGVIEKISWRTTTVRTFDKRPVYLPNSIFSQIAVENPSRMSHRRFYETIGLRYDDIGRMEAITKAVRAMLTQHEAIDSAQTLMVYFNAFNASSCDFFLYAFTRTTDWERYHKLKHELLLSIAAIIEEHGAQIAYPTQTLYAPDVQTALAGQAGASAGEAPG